MTTPVPASAQKRKRGNPEWGKPPAPIGACLTEFEAEVARLGLAKEEYVSSVKLKHWCDRNRNRVYIPEWLLTKWDMEVETNWGAA